MSGTCTLDRPPTTKGVGGKVRDSVQLRGRSTPTLTERKVNSFLLPPPFTSIPIRTEHNVQLFSRVKDAVELFVY